MKKENMRSESTASRSSMMMRLRLISVAAVLLVCCLAFVGVAGAEEAVDLPEASVEELTETDYTHAVEFTLGESLTDIQKTTYGEWNVELILTLYEELELTSGGNYLGVKYSDSWEKFPSSENTNPTTLETETELIKMILGDDSKLTVNGLYDLEEPITKFSFGLHLSETEIPFGWKIEFRITNPDNTDDSETICEFVSPPVPPTATVTKLENGDLTFALNFLADEPTEGQLAYYGDWYADYVLTLSKDFTANSDKSADGYLSGEYGSNGWVNVPPEDVTLTANEGMKIMEYAAELLEQSGLKLTYRDVYSFVKDFNCGIFLDEEYLIRNSDVVITLELKMFNPVDERVSYTIGEPYIFEPDTKYYNLTFSYEGDTINPSISESYYYIMNTTVLTDNSGNLNDNIVSYTLNDDGSLATPGSGGYSTTVVVIPKTIPGKIGHTFVGWGDIPKKLEADTVIKPVFVGNETVITLYDDTVKLEDVTTTYGKDTIDGSIPTAPKTGYTFDGWYTDNLLVISDSGELVSDVEGYTDIDGNWIYDVPALSLYANWTANMYIVSFNANGGEGTMADKTFFYDDEPKPLTANAFTRDGHTFNGWNTEEDGSGIAYSDKQSVQNLTAENGGTVTLYAQWKENEKTPTVTPDSNKPNRVITTTKPTYQVVFYPNGGSGEMNAVTFVEGEQKAIPVNTFTREGYTFKGWALTSGGEVFYTDGESVLIDGTTSLYAVWEEVVQEKPEEPTDDPSDKPTEPTTPAPLLSMLAGLGAAVLLRRK